MNEADYLAAIIAALGPYAESSTKPDGGRGYFVEGEVEPYAVYYGDGSDIREFSKAKEAIKSAEEFRAEAEEST